MPLSGGGKGAICLEPGLLGWQLPLEVLAKVDLPLAPEAARRKRTAGLGCDGQSGALAPACQAATSSWNSTSVTFLKHGGAEKPAWGSISEKVSSEASMAMSSQHELSSLRSLRRLSQDV